MNLKCGLFAAAIVLGISTHSLADSKGDALDLLNRGAATVAIANKVPILIEARTSITHGNDSPRNGLLRLIFVDEQNWRQEYKDDFYEETETSRSGMVFTNADYEKRPFPLDEIYASLHHLLPMHPPDGYKPEKIKEVQKDGAKYRCLLFRRGSMPILCTVLILTGGWPKEVKKLRLPHFPTTAISAMEVFRSE